VVDGVFVPWFEHEGFMEAMEWSRELFLAGAINQDFAAQPLADFHTPIGAGLAGWHINVSDEARRTANRLRDNGFMTQEELDAGEMVWVMGTLTNRHGERRVAAQSGHAGYVAISTIGAPTDEDLQHHLNFLNGINSPQGQNIVSWGAEGYNWENVGGRVRQFVPDEIPPHAVVVEGLNQFMMLQNHVMGLYGVNSREDAITEVQLTNLNYAIHDPQLPFLSDTWTAQQASLNTILDDAVINFVMGNIDDAGFRVQLDRWYAEGGQASIDELSAAWAEVN
jgi:putative aldouronate transport system substrate-binding protein